MPGGAVPPLVTAPAAARAGNGVVRGACPSVAVPFATADGALVRVLVPDGTVSADQLRALASMAAPGPTIEITSRANVQLRALTADALARAAAVLGEAGLVARRGDDRRDVVVSPLAGLDADEVLDPRPLARAIAAALAAAPGDVAPKFGVLLDGGGRVHLRGRRQAVALGAVRLVDGTAAWEVVHDGALPLTRSAGETLTVAATEAVPALVVRLATGGAAPAGRPVSAGEVVAPASSLAPGGPFLGWGPVRPAGLRWFGAAPVLGRMTAAQARDLAALADRAGGEVRLSPWRGVVLPAVATAGADAIPEALSALGFVVDGGDPAAHVVACVGRTGCPSGAVDAAGDARALIDALRARPRDGRPPTVHVSGCAKACASRARVDVTLMGLDDGTYDVHDGRSPGGPLGAVVATGVSPERAIALASGEHP